MNKSLVHLRSWWPILLLIVLWLAVYQYIDNPVLIPSPAGALEALWNYFEDPRFHISVISTMTNLVTAWLIVQAMLLLTLLLQFNPILHKIFEKWAFLFQALPTFAILPILIVLLGFGPAMLYTCIVFSNYWVGTNYLLTATKQSTQQWHEQCDNLGWNTWQRFSRVYVYSMMPYLINLASITWSMCWRTLMALEVLFGSLGSQLGLGVLMQQERMMFDVAEIWAILLVIMTISIAVNQLFILLRNRIHW